MEENPLRRMCKFFSTSIVMEARMELSEYPIKFRNHFKFYKDFFTIDIILISNSKIYKSFVFTREDLILLTESNMEDVSFKNFHEGLLTNQPLDLDACYSFMYSEGLQKLVTNYFKNNMLTFNEYVLTLENSFENDIKSLLPEKIAISFKALVSFEEQERRKLVHLTSQSFKDIPEDIIGELKMIDKGIFSCSEQESIEKLKETYKKLLKKFENVTIKESWLDTNDTYCVAGYTIILDEPAKSVLKTYVEAYKAYIYARTESYTVDPTALHAARDNFHQIINDLVKKQHGVSLKDINNIPE